MGLAMYAILVLSLLVSSLTCGVMTMVQAWRSSQIYGSELQSGLEVSPWRLSELRKWGVLEGEQTPALYHDHSVETDGSSGCLVMNKDLVLWTDKVQRKRLTIAGATLSGDDTQVTLRQGADQIQCPFWPGDGADRLLSMLNTDAKQKPAPKPEVLENGL
jgi:hypothetical protein